MDRQKHKGLQETIQQVFENSNPNGLPGLVSSLLCRGLKLIEDGKASQGISIVKELILYGFKDIAPTGSSDINIYSQSFKEKLELLEKLQNANP